METERTVLITGTSTGIGAACAARLAASGWRVYAGVRRAEDGERLVSSYTGLIVPVHLEVTDSASIAAVIARIDDEVGGLDGVVNNAGINVSGPVELLDESEWREQFDVNFFGVVSVTRASFPLVDRAGGRFVHSGSISGRVGSPGLGPYSASKHAIEGFNWALRAELGAIGPMTSSVVEPGMIRTAIWDKGRVQLRDAEDRLRRSGLTQRYDWMLDLYHARLAEAFDRAIDADRVAQAVEHALTAERPKARYLVGADARLQAALAHLPDRLRAFLFGKAYERYRANGRALRSRARDRG
jgi:NAD(P)-dependent dehydrogenase (short-subunit alcohol dehydrogenase family)